MDPACLVVSPPAARLGHIPQALVDPHELKVKPELIFDRIEDNSIDNVTVTQIIATAARECTSSFIRLAREDRWAEDQQGRFQIWAANIGVFARGHASLDYRLRDTPDILELIMQQVSILKGHLSSRTSISLVSDT